MSEYFKSGSYRVTVTYEMLVEVVADDYQTEESLAKTATTFGDVVNTEVVKQ